MNGVHHKRTIVRGDRFGRLTVIREVDPSQSGRRRFICACECGNTKIILLPSLTKGATRSCGCLHRQIARNRFLHGLKREKKQHPLYLVWRGIKTRCYNPRCQAFKNYGGRGIRIAAEWENNPVLFVEWCKTHGWEKHLTVNRIDSRDNYEPANIEFLSKSDNSKHRFRVERIQSRGDFATAVLSLPA